MLFLALRHLFSRKRQTFFIFAGIVLGTLTYVVISGLQLGFREFIIEQLVENDAHLKITAHEELISPDTLNRSFYPQNNVIVHWHVPPFGKRDEAHILNPMGWFEKLKNDSRVIAYSEQLTTQVIAGRGGVKAAAQLVGVNPEKQSNVTIIKKYITDGHYMSIGQTGNRIAVGDGLLNKIGARVSESIMIASGGGEPRPFKIVASFHLGVQQIDDNFIYGALRDVQQLNSTPGRISQIAVRLFDVTEARSVADEWSQLGHDKVQSWDQANASFLQVFKIQDLFRIFITVGILVVASFGIYNVLSIIVNQKKREIAILRSLGFPPSDILQLFLIQGLILGFAGALVGLLLGFVLCLGLSNLDFRFMGNRMLIISFDRDIYVTGFFMAFVSSIVASLLPARSASKMTPIDIIRSEGT